MRQDMADVTPLTVVVNNNNEAVLVSGDVEHHELTNLIRTSEKLSHISKIPPAGALNGFDPMP